MTSKDHTEVIRPARSIDRFGGVIKDNGIALARLLLLVVSIAVWQFASYTLGGKFAGIFVPLETILETTYLLLASGELVPHIIVTGKEVFWAFVIAFALGLIIGTVLGANQYLASAIEPIIYYISTVPKIVYYPLLIMLFGVGPGSKIAKGVMSAFFPIVILVTAGALNVNSVHVQVGRLYRASPLEQLQKVYLPSMISYVINALRLGMGAAIVSVTLAEIFVSKAGLGNRIAFYFGQFALAKMYAILLLIFVVAFALNMALLGLQNYLAANGYGGGEGGGGGFGF